MSDVDEVRELAAIKKSVTAIAVVSIVALAVVMLTYAAWFNGSLSQSQEHWGQFGDFVGGTVNPVLSCLSLLALLLTVNLQLRQLRHGRDDVPPL